MAYKRYKGDFNLSKEKKVELMSEYVAYYKNLIDKHGMDSLNVKIPREVFSETLDEIGTLIQEKALKMATDDGEIKRFLSNNPLPSEMQKLLPDEFRAFSLLLNALKQWISAESAATDRYFLGGTARQICKEAADTCIVTSEELKEGAELHHPMRDGRPPILLSKKGHTLIEQNPQNNSDYDEIFNQIKKIRSERNQSWVQLREGSNGIISRNTNIRANAKSFANKVINELGLSANDIIEILNSRGL